MWHDPITDKKERQERKKENGQLQISCRFQFCRIHIPNCQRLAWKQCLQHHHLYFPFPFLRREGHLHAPTHPERKTRPSMSWPLSRRQTTDSHRSSLMPSSWHWILLNIAIPRVLWWRLAAFLNSTAMDWTWSLSWSQMVSWRFGCGNYFGDFLRMLLFWREKKKKKKVPSANVQNF